MDERNILISELYSALLFRYNYLKSMEKHEEYREESYKSLISEESSEEMAYFTGKCPKCETYMEEYNHKLAWGIGAAAVGALLLGPVGLTAGIMGIKDSNTGWKCPSCGYSMANEDSAVQQWLVNGFGRALGNETKRQFSEGYQRGLEMHEDDYDD